MEFLSRLWRWLRVSPPEPAGVDVLDPLLPFEGWREAGLVGRVDSDGRVVELAFESMTRSDFFAIDAEAVCRDHVHPAPAPGCHCGFYSLGSRADILARCYSGAVDRAHNVVLGVRLSGTVVEGSRGLRASRQTVRSVELAPRCSAPSCDAAPVGVSPFRTVAILPSGRWMDLRPVCASHGRFDDLSRTASASVTLSAVPPLSAVSLERLAELAGVPVSVQPVFVRPPHPRQPAIDEMGRALGDVEVPMLASALVSAAAASLAVFAASVSVATLLAVVALLVPAVVAAWCTSRRRLFGRPWPAMAWVLLPWVLTVGSASALAGSAVAGSGSAAAPVWGLAVGVGLFGLLVLVVRALWVEVSTLWGPLGHPVGLWSFVTAGSILSLLVMALFVHHAFFAVDLVESARVSGPLFRPQ